MSSKTYRLVLVALVAMAMGLFGCLPRVLTPSSRPVQRPPAQKEQARPAPKQPSPRAIASLRLTDQGRVLLKRGQPDNAISALERAVSLHPTNGENYYYLAEAWLIKGNTAQAKEFNQLAGTYLKNETRWAARVQTQRKLIESRSAVHDTK